MRWQTCGNWEGCRRGTDSRKPPHRTQPDQRTGGPSQRCAAGKPAPGRRVGHAVRPGQHHQEVHLAHQGVSHPVRRHGRGVGRHVEGWEKPSGAEREARLGLRALLASLERTLPTQVRSMAARVRTASQMLLSRRRAVRMGPDSAQNIMRSKRCAPSHCISINSIDANYYLTIMTVPTQNHATPTLGDVESRVRQDLYDLRDKLSYSGSSHRWTCRFSRARGRRSSRARTASRVIAVQHVPAAAYDEDPLDAFSDAWRAFVGYRNAMADVQQLRRPAAMALIFAETRTKPIATSEQAAHPKGARRANQRPAGAWGTRFGLASITRRLTSPRAAITGRPGRLAPRQASRALLASLERTLPTLARSWQQDSGRPCNVVVEAESRAHVARFMSEHHDVTTL